MGVEWTERGVVLRAPKCSKKDYRTTAVKISFFFQITFTFRVQLQHYAYRSRFPGSNSREDNSFDTTRGGGLYIYIHRTLETSLCTDVSSQWTVKSVRIYTSRKRKRSVDNARLYRYDGRLVLLYSRPHLLFAERTYDLDRIGLYLHWPRNEKTAFLLNTAIFMRAHVCVVLVSKRFMLQASVF